MRLPDHARDGLVDARVQAERQAVAGGIDLVEQRVEFARACSAARAAPGRTPRAAARRGCRSRSASAARSCRGAARRASACTGCTTRRPRARIASMWRWIVGCASASITGPTSMASCAGLPTRSSRIAPSSISSTRSAASSCTHSTRSAEQRWPALSKAEASTSPPPARPAPTSRRPSRSARRSRRSAAPAGRRRRALRQRALQQARDLGRAGEQHALHARIGRPARAPTVSPRPGSSCSASRGTPAARSTRTASAATSGVCSAGLASTGLPAASAAATWPVKIASGKFHGLMHTHRAERPMRAVVEVAPHLRRVVAQEVDRLAHLGHRVGRGLAGLAHEQAEQLGRCRLPGVGRALQRSGALGRRRRGPGRRGLRRRSAVRRRRRSASASCTRADDVAAIGRIAHRPRPPPGSSTAEQRRGVPALRARSRQRLRPARPAASRRLRSIPREFARSAAEQVARQRDRRMRRPTRAFALRPAARTASTGSCTSSSSGHRRVGDAIDERGVGAVLEQAPHEVGQQRLVRAHRRVDAAGPAELAFGPAPTTCSYSGSPMPCRHWNSYCPA